jgi:hypothetical protein
MDMASSRVKRFLAISSYSELALLSKPTTFGTETGTKNMAFTISKAILKTRIVFPGMLHESKLQAGKGN